MADKPQILINEIDSTGKSKSFDLSSVSAGIGYFKAGEAFKPMLITDAFGFENEFGKCYADNVYDHANLSNFFSESGGAPIHIMRLIHNELPKAGIIGTGYAFSAGSANAGISVTTSGVYVGDISMLFLNSDEYLNKKNAGVSMDPTEILRLYFKNAGEVGNMYKVAICNETKRADGSVYISGTSNRFKDVFKYPLGNTSGEYEIGIILLNSNNEVIEKWVVSTVAGHKNIYGENNYIEDYLLAKSAYIRAFHNKSIATSVLPTIITAQYLMDGSSAPVCHHMADAIPAFYVNSKTVDDNLIISGLKIFRNAEEYQFDLFVDSGYSFDHNVLLNVKVDDDNSVNLVIAHDSLVPNLYILKVDDSTADMDLGEKVKLKTAEGDFVGFAKCIAKYGYHTPYVAMTHFIVVETDKTVLVGYKVEFDGGSSEVDVLSISNLNSKLKGHGYLDSQINTYLAPRVDSHAIMANGIYPDLFSSMLKDSVFEGLADSYVASASIDGTSKMSSYASMHFNAMYNYIPDLDVFMWIPISGLVAGRFVRTDRTDGQFYANAGARGVTYSTTLLYSPSEDCRIKLNNKFINTAYIDAGKVVLDGNKTMYKLNSYFGSIDIRRTSLFIKKVAYFEGLRVQFKFNTGGDRDKFVLRMDKRMDELKKSREAIKEYRIIDSTQIDDERLDRARFKIGFKPYTTIEFVDVTLSLDDIGMTYTE